MDQPPKRDQVDLAEYVFLLPQLLAVSPLFVVFQHIREWGENADFIYSFRLITLAYLLMVMTIILFLWRPSIRRKNTFRRNLTRVSSLGILATLPVPLAMRVLSKYENVSVQLFTTLETVVSSVALIVCVALNAGCLVQLFRTGRAPVVHRFDFFSFALQLILLGLLIKWW